MPIAAIQNALGQLLRGNQKQEEILMKTKRLLFISCLAAGALIASPSFGKPAKKSAGMSQSKATRVAPHTTQVMRHNQNISARMGGTRYYGGTRYTGTRSYATRQYSGTRYYGGNAQLRQLLRGRHRLLLRRIRLPVLQLLFRLAILELGLWHIRGILPVLVWGRLSVQWLQQLLLVLHAHHTAITDQWLHLCSSVLADSVTTTA